MQVVLDLVQKYHPAYWNTHYQEINAYAAEAFCEEVRMTIRNKCLADPAKLAIQAFDSRDGQILWQIMQDTWWGMPESLSVRDEPGFFVLCDLCSEFPGECEDEA